MSKIEVGSLGLLVDDLAQQYNLPPCVVWSMVGQLVKDERSHITVSKEYLEELEKHVLASCLADNNYLFE